MFAQKSSFGQLSFWLGLERRVGVFALNLLKKSKNEDPSFGLHHSRYIVKSSLEPKASV